VGVRGTLAGLLRVPKPAAVPGLRHANVGLCANLGGSVIPVPNLRRVALVAFWDDDAAIDDFERSHPLAARLADGWSVRLDPLRAFGSWPGLDTDVPRGRNVADHEGEVVVLTLGRFKVRRAVPFFRASNKAENAVVGASGLRWATGIASPPFVATCSIWDSGEQSAQYAYAEAGGGHPDALAKDRAVGGFHKQSAFIRFQPHAMRGGLGGTNPLTPAPS
jgi:hypothetical protein